MEEDKQKIQITIHHHRDNDIQNHILLIGDQVKIYSKDTNDKDPHLYIKEIENQDVPLDTVMNKNSLYKEINHHQDTKDPKTINLEIDSVNKEEDLQAKDKSKKIILEYLHQLGVDNKIITSKHLIEEMMAEKHNQWEEDLNKSTTIDLLEN